MSFLRRVFGGGSGAGASGGGAGAPVDPVQADADDAARDRELLREEAERVSDDLLARQLRYADRSWTPPAQGGPQRADQNADAE